MRLMQEAVLSGEGVEDEADQTQQEQEQDRMRTASRWRRLVATMLVRDQEGELPTASDS